MVLRVSERLSTPVLVPVGILMSVRAVVLVLHTLDAQLLSDSGTRHGYAEILTSQCLHWEGDVDGKHA